MNENAISFLTMKMVTQNRLLISESSLLFVGYDSYEYYLLECSKLSLAEFEIGFELLFDLYPLVSDKLRDRVYKDLEEQYPVRGQQTSDIFQEGMPISKFSKN